ncbi:hypothetical protein JW979_07065, partial [bacterium]|nr:hypothetical protein [candidate division CSSED10-310 bacterium]
AQETRMYTWAAFWTSLAILSLLRVSCYRSWAVIYTLSLSACIWTHNYGWLLFAGAILFSVHQRLKIGWYHFTVFLLVSPWLMIMIRQLGADTTPWIPKPLPSFLWETIIHYSGVPPFLSSAVLIQSVVDIGAASLIILVLMASLRSITRIKALFYFVLLPLGMAFFLSYLKPIYLPGRHDFLFHTLFLSLAACAITPSVPLKKIAYGILFLFGCIQFYYGHLYFARFEKSNDREVAAYLKTMDLSEDDIMITTDLSASPLIYYLGKNFAIFQPFPEGQAGWLPRKLLENDTRYISNEINRFSSLLDAYSGNGDRVILVVCSEIPGTKELQSFLDQHLVYEKSYVFTPARRYNQIHSLRCYHFPETGLFAEPENLDSQASEGTRAVSNSLTSTP